MDMDIIVLMGSANFADNSKPHHRKDFAHTSRVNFIITKVDVIIVMEVITMDMDIIIVTILKNNRHHLMKEEPTADSDAFLFVRFTVLSLV